MGSQITEGTVGQMQLLLDTIRRLRRHLCAGAFQHQHHAEEADRVVACNAVIDIADHQLGGQRRLAMADAIGIDTAGGQVIQHPLFVAELLGDVIDNGFTQPAKAIGQARTAGHQQRHGVLHMVVGLLQEGGVAGQRNALLDGMRDDGRAQQLLALLLCGLLQLLEKSHGRSPEVGFRQGWGKKRHPAPIAREQSAATRPCDASGRCRSTDRPWH